MNDREKLIRKALHAYHDVEDRGQSWEWSAESVKDMRAAMAVFENAMFEREALAWEAGVEHEADYHGHRYSPASENPYPRLASGSANNASD